MSEYKPIETVKHSSVVREDDDSELSAIRIEEGKFKRFSGTIFENAIRCLQKI